MKRLAKAYVFFSLLAIIAGCTEEDDSVNLQTSKFISIVDENYIKENERKWDLIYNNSNILNLNNLEYNETRFYQVDNSTDYNDFIVNAFINPELADNYTLKLIKTVSN